MDAAADFTSLPRAADRLGVPLRALREAVRCGEVRAYSFGRTTRVRIDELRRWAELHRLDACPVCRRPLGVTVQ